MIGFPYLTGVSIVLQQKVLFNELRGIWLSLTPWRRRKIDVSQTYVSGSTRREQNACFALDFPVLCSRINSDVRCQPFVSNCIASQAGSSKFVRFVHL